MAVTLVNLSGFVWSIASAETGLNCAKFDVEVEPEINEWVPNIDGQARGKVVGDPMGKLSIEGEISSTNTGLMAATFTTAFIPVNSANYFGRTQGGWYSDRLKISLERGVLVKASGEFTSHYNVP